MDFTVHVYHHLVKDENEVLRRLGELDAKMVDLLAQGERNMTEVTGQMKEVLDKIDTAANELAARVEAKVAAMAEGMDQEEAAPLLQFGNELAERLRGIAADPANPVPEGTGGALGGGTGEPGGGGQ